MDRNWIIFTYGFIKNLRQIHPRDSHVEFTGKNEIGNIPHEQNYAAWLAKNNKTVFSKLTQKISLPVSGEPGEEVKIAINLQFSFPRILDCYFSEISCNYHFRQIFNGFWTSNFDFYWSLALQFSCVMVRLSESRFQ